MSHPEKEPGKREQFLQFLRDQGIDVTEDIERIVQKAASRKRKRTTKKSRKLKSHRDAQQNFEQTEMGNLNDSRNWNNLRITVWSPLREDDYDEDEISSESFFNFFEDTPKKKKCGENQKTTPPKSERDAFLDAIADFDIKQTEVVTSPETSVVPDIIKVIETQVGTHLENGESFGAVGMEQLNVELEPAMEMTNAALPVDTITSDTVEGAGNRNDASIAIRKPSDVSFEMVQANADVELEQNIDMADKIVYFDSDPPKDTVVPDTVEAVEIEVDTNVGLRGLSTKASKQRIARSLSEPRILPSLRESIGQHNGLYEVKYPINLGSLVLVPNIDDTQNNMNMAVVAPVDDQDQNEVVPNLEAQNGNEEEEEPDQVAGIEAPPLLEFVYVEPVVVWIPKENQKNLTKQSPNKPSEQRVLPTRRCTLPKEQSAVEPPIPNGKRRRSDSDAYMPPYSVIEKLKIEGPPVRKRRKKRKPNSNCPLGK